MKTKLALIVRRSLIATTTTSICLIAVLLVAILVSLHPTTPAFADGGAPNLAYVAGTSRGVAVIDVAQRRIARTISIAGSPHNVLLSLDGSLLYVTQPARGQVSLLEAATGKILCSARFAGQPSIMALSPQNDVFYVAGNDNTGIHVLDAKTCALRATFQTTGPVHALAISFLSGAFPKHQGDYQLWATTPGGLMVFDTNGTQLANLPLAADPQSLCIPPGLIAYITTGQGTVVALDLSTMRFTAPLLRGGPFGTMDYDAATGEIYVPEQKQHQIAVLAPVLSGTQIEPGKLARQLPLPGVPQAVAITSDGQLGFVALQDGRVVMLDIPARQPVTTITVGGQPQSVITGLYPPASINIPPPTSSQPTNQIQPLWHNIPFIISVILFALATLALITLILLWRRIKLR